MPFRSQSLKYLNWPACTQAICGWAGRAAWPSAFHCTSMPMSAASRSGDSRSCMMGSRTWAATHASTAKAATDQERPQQARAPKTEAAAARNAAWVGLATAIEATAKEPTPTEKANSCITLPNKLLPRPRADFFGGGGGALCPLFFFSKCFMRSSTEIRSSWSVSSSSKIFVSSSFAYSGIMYLKASRVSVLFSNPSRRPLRRRILSSTIFLFDEKESAMR
mmetsp:Transcript_5104/g.16228  ORF Transcript_5104/g.16228 Transcript_5104/m.16228 type:complete len:221 (+) Transcript_5104:289-951(+)